MSEQALQALIDNEIQKKHTYSVLLSVQSEDGRVQFAGAAGKPDPAEDRVMTTETPFFIASITKLYTVAVTLNLVDQGRIDLDERIAAYLPAEMLRGLHVYKGTDYGDQIKVYQLLSHRSGIADYFEDRPKGGRSILDDALQGIDRLWTPEEIFERTRQLTPRFAPNDRKAHYSDSGFELLAAVIRHVTGKELREHFQELIFAPLGLQRTYPYDYRSLRDDEQPALFYNKDAVMRIPKTMSGFDPHGGIVSTLDESQRFLQAFMQGQLFDRRHFARMTAHWNTIFFPVVSYGMGLMRYKLPRLFSPFRQPPTFLGHSGSSNAFAFHVPEHDLYITGTLNQLHAPSRSVTFLLKVVHAVTDF